jgi:hypothetical protein
MLGRYPENLSKVPWEAVKRVLKYLKKTLHYGLELGGGIERDSNQLKAYGVRKIVRNGLARRVIFAVRILSLLYSPILSFYFTCRRDFTPLYPSFV